MAAGFSPHNPTGHVHQSSCCSGHEPKLAIEPPSSLDDLITLYDLTVESSTSKVNLAPKANANIKGAAKSVQDTLDIINDLSQYLARAPFPHCPPQPQLVQNNARSQQINKMKEDGNVAFKGNNFERAVELYTLAAEAAATRPLFEPSMWVKEELSVVLCNRAAAYQSMKKWVEALCDAEAVIQLKRNWSKGHFRKAKALQGMGKLDQARDAALLGLEFEPDNADLRSIHNEIAAASAE
ncbi:hypothetical protein DFH28DRAFT_525980 [Melampsora americana]|nr:hypothetical protein DFH28DRAFT_525980 [Melampsora americana]